MSMLRSLESPDHARLRFLGTVVTTDKNVPVYINSIHEDWSATCTILNSNKTLTMQDLRKEIITSPVSLGFCQIDKEAVYVTRRPSRRSKQGLDLEDVHIYRTNGAADFTITSVSVKKAIAKTILGDFCSFKTAAVSINKEEKSLAFNKDWALDNDGSGEIFVIYKFFGRCGKVENGKITLFPNFTFLRETLEEDVGNVHN
jgi:hypothetical protein